MWRRLLARWRSRWATSPVAIAAAAPTIAPALLLPGSNGRPFPALTAIREACASAAHAPEVLLFGDSVMERVSRHDVDRRDLGALVAAALPALSVLKISHSAFNPVIYAALARVVAQCPRVPRVTVLPINLRCFSPQWDLHPAWQFTQEIACIEAWLADSTSEIPALQDVRETAGFLADYAAQPVNYPLSGLRTVGEFRARVLEAPGNDAARDSRARDIFIFHYTHPLTPDHRRLTALRDTVASLMGAGTRVLAYVTPVNHAAGVRLVSDAFATSVRHNVRVLRAALAGTEIQLLDLSDALAADRFFHEDLATEHLNETGRAELAARVADAVRAV